MVQLLLICIVSENIVVDILEAGGTLLQLSNITRLITFLIQILENHHQEQSGHC